MTARLSRGQLILVAYRQAYKDSAPPTPIPMALDQDKLDALRIDRDAKALPRGGVTRWWWLGAGLVLAVAITFWLTRSDRPIQVRAATVQAPVAVGQGSTVLNASGYVVARRIATVSSKVTGKIVEVLIEEGASVTAGQVLARLDDSTVKARLALAKSQAGAARDRLREIQVRLAEAERNLERARSLRAQNLVSASALDTASADAAALRARLAAARAEVRVADDNVALAQQDLDDLVIRAPFAGVVISKNAQPGEMISPISAGGGFTRTGIGTIVDMDSREIEVDVNEAYINRVYPEQPVETVLDAYPDSVIPGRVINIVPTADRNRATVKVRIAFDQLDPRILPDMGIRVRFKEEEAAGAAPVNKAVALVNSSSIFSDAGRDYVWLIDGGVLEKRAIRLAADGTDNGGLRGVLAGLRPGQRVVAEPASDLAAGSRVEVE